MPYLKSLTRELQEMWALVLLQHQKALIALLELDKDLAREIFLIEERVNSCEQFIESDCESYLSLNGSGPVDISPALFILKTTRQLEIIGDLGKKIATDILNSDSSYPTQLLAESNMEEIFRSSNKILQLALQAFEDSDTSLAQVIMSRIEICREMILEGDSDLLHYLVRNPQERSHGLSLFSIIESIKRTIEVSQTISQGIINNNRVATVAI